MNRRIAVALVALALALGPVAVPFVLAGTNGVALDDQYEVFEDQQLQVAAPGVLANDFPEDSCVISSDDTGLDGSIGLGVGADGHFQFTPTGDFNGSTSFTYSMGQQSGGCPAGQPDEGLVTIVVNEVNDPPGIVLDSVCQNDVSVAEDSGAFADPGHCVEMVDFGPSDENNQNFSAWVVSSNNDNLFSVQPSIIQVDGLFGRLEFTPAPNANGTARVTVRGRDTGGTANGGDDLSDPRRFDIVIAPANDAPTAVADTFQALPNQTLNIGSPGVLKNDSDIDGDTLTASKVSNPAHGIVNLASDGGFSYTPTAGYIGPDAFSYRASDGSANSATRVVTINVTAVPTAVPTVAPPTQAPSAAATPEGSVEPSPSGSVEPSASVDPNASPSAGPSAGASLEPGASAAPDPTSGAGGLSLPVLVVSLVLISLLAFGAAIYVPKLVERYRSGGSIDET